MDHLSFRQATEEDLPFLWDLRQVTMKPFVEKSYGWRDSIQYEYARENLDIAKIITWDNDDVGVLKVVEREAEFFLDQIQVHPSSAGRGIGTFILNELIKKALSSNKAIRLYVIKANPAFGLYQKCGFKVRGADEFRYEMIFE